MQCFTAGRAQANSSQRSLILIEELRSHIALYALLGASSRLDKSSRGGHSERVTGFFLEIREGVLAASALDQANLILGIIGVWLMIRRSLWAFPVGLVAVSVQGVLFYQSRFYADATLQIFFLVALAYGWWHWCRGSGNSHELPVTKLSRQALVLTLGLSALGWIVWAIALRNYTDAIMPFRDAFIAAFSVAAQVLQARKNIENWPLWIGVNIVAVASYWMGGLYYTALLFAIYLCMAIGGWHEWRRAMPKKTS